jgi:bla regulator protein BlaR1
MILAASPFSSSSLAAFGAPIANHLWQSTLFAAIAGFLTLLLRKNHARMRYALWLVASIKFLIPFSLLVLLGSHLAWSKAAAFRPSNFSFAMQEISLPFAPLHPAPAPATFLGTAARLFPALLLFVWLCGCATVLFFWCLRWRRVTAATRSASPANSGRELEAMHRVDQNMGIPTHVRLSLARSALEPGIVGIFRPILVLPAGISGRLTDAQLDAIITHELCHVRRRDNLAAALHMLVEVLFWFHPVIWWIGARLVDERERACDEAVLSLGSDPQVYAEGILRVCKFYVESPLFCAAGVTGSNLKSRIEAIMVHRSARDLGFSKKLFLATMALLGLIGPVVYGLLDPLQTRAESQTHNAPSAVVAFADASIKPNRNDTPMAGFNIKGKPFTAVLSKPNRFMATNVTLRGLLRIAYGVQDSQIVGGPDWLNSEKFDVDARVAPSLVEQLSKLSRDQAGLESGHMLQALLVEHFKLSLHREIRDLPTFALVLAEGGPKFHEAKPGDTYPDGPKGPGRPAGPGTWEPEKGTLVVQGQPIAALVMELSAELGQMVVDKTGLAGNYDFTLRWTPGASQDADHDASSIRTAVQEQLGLKLELQNTPTEVLVIDHAEPIIDGTSSRFQSGPSFEVASIKPTKSGDDKTSILFPPSGFTATSVTLQMLIRAAYGVEDSRISGAPSWLNSEYYDVDARVDSSGADEVRKPSEDQLKVERQRLLQTLLADRFKLTVHREAKVLPNYALVIAENGPKLQEAKPGDTYGDGLKGVDGLPAGPHFMDLRRGGEFKAQAEPVALLARILSRVLGSSVLDKTGLTGDYDFKLKWTPDASLAPSYKGTNSSESSGPSIFTALQEQLGLKLVTEQGPVEVLVIDHAEQPSGN